MTQEEKARAYDEALERARKMLNMILDNELLGFPDQIREIFPQLRENDGEWIRKYLIEELKAAKSVGKLKFTIPQPTREECIAYLEKQKEQKPILEVFGFKVGDAVRLKDGDGRKHIIKSFEEVEGLHGPNFYHVEFEDNLARDGIYPGEEYPNGYYTQMEKIEEEQKAAEWSEVELEFRGEKVTVKRPFYRDNKGRGYSTAELDEDVAWNALRAWCEKKGISLYDLYPKAEWSEEDKDKVIQYLHDKDGGMLWVKATEITEDILDILRPRPSWKPSEEQMEALEECGECKRCIKKLYEDLQKRYGTC